MMQLHSPTEDAVIALLRQSGPCLLDNLILRLPNHKWGDLFIAVDQMSRDGRLVLRRGLGSTYHLFLPPEQAAFRSDNKEVRV